MQLTIFFVSGVELIVFFVNSPFISLVIFSTKLFSDSSLDGLQVRPIFHLHILYVCRESAQWMVQYGLPYCHSLCGFPAVIQEHV